MTLIEFCVRTFSWATYRQTKGAIKLNMLLDHDGYFPVSMDFIHGNVHEVTCARNLNFSHKQEIVRERWYVDYTML